MVGVGTDSENSALNQILLYCRPLFSVDVSHCYQLLAKCERDASVSVAVVIRCLCVMYFFINTFRYGRRTLLVLSVDGSFVREIDGVVRRNRVDIFCIIRYLKMVKKVLNFCVVFGARKRRPPMTNTTIATRYRQHHPLMPPNKAKYRQRNASVGGWVSIGV